MTDISGYRRCPNCHGVFPGQRRESCPDCSVPLTSDGFVEKAMVMKKIDAEKAMGAVEGLLFYKYVLRRLNIRCKFTECTLRYVPFLKLRAYVTGRMDGYKDEGGEVPFMVPATKYVYRTMTWTGNARNADNFGVHYLRNLAYEVELYATPFCPEPGITVPPDDAVRNGSSAMERAAIRELKSEGLYGAKIRRVNVYPLEVTLLCYPVWAIKYDYAGLPLHAAVDGVTGEFLAGGMFDDILARSLVALVLGATLLLIFNILFNVNIYIGYGLLILFTGLGYGVIVDLLTFIRYGQRVAGDKIECLLRRSRSSIGKRSLLARIGAVVGFGIIVLSSFGLESSFFFYYFLLVNGLAFYLLSCFFVCDMYDRVKGQLREDV